MSLNKQVHKLHCSAAIAELVTAVCQKPVPHSEWCLQSAELHNPAAQSSGTPIIDVTAQSALASRFAQEWDGASMEL